jgi:hypothetical protein
MKRLLVTILAMLYLGASTGATIHLHYCMGKLVDMKLWHSEANKCGKCGMKKSTTCKKSCCKDEHKTVKVEKDHQKAAESALQLMQIAAAIPVDYFELPQVYITSIAQELPVSHAPPLSIPLHILHCTFRI